MQFESFSSRVRQVMIQWTACESWVVQPARRCAIDTSEPMRCIVIQFIKKMQKKKKRKKLIKCVIRLKSFLRDLFQGLTPPSGFLCRGLWSCAGRPLLCEWRAELLLLSLPASPSLSFRSSPAFCVCLKKKCQEKRQILSVLKAFTLFIATSLRSKFKWEDDQKYSWRRRVPPVVTSLAPPPNYARSCSRWEVFLINYTS